MKLGRRWLRSRLVGGALILGYHRIAEPSSDFFSLCVKPKHFSEHLTVLRQQANPMSLQELAKGLERGNVSSGAIVVTFDDGYADNLHNAKPLLEQYEVPATIFVATGCLGREFWWDGLERLILRDLAAPAEIRLVLSRVPLEWGLDEDDSRKRRRHLMGTLYQAFRLLPENERQSKMEDLRRQIGVVCLNVDGARALTSSEVARLASSDLIDVGSHSHTHPPLASLAVEDQRFEIRYSKKRLQEIVDRPVVGFSYPNGSTSQTTRRLVSQAGYAYACQSDADVAWNASQRFRLPRFWIPDCDGETFARWIHRWLTK